MQAIILFLCLKFFIIKSKLIKQKEKSEMGEKGQNAKAW